MAQIAQYLSDFFAGTYKAVNLNVDSINVA